MLWMIWRHNWNPPKEWQVLSLVYRVLSLYFPAEIGFYIQPKLKTRYDYNLTIMKSPKPATDNLFKK